MNVESENNKEISITSLVGDLNPFKTELSKHSKRKLVIFWSLIFVFWIFMSCTTIILYEIMGMQLMYSKHAMNRGEQENIIELIDEIERIYANNYIGEAIDASHLEDAILAGLAYGHLDKYGYYASPEMRKEAERERDEILTGIGVEIVRDGESRYYISKIFPDSPASDAGLQVGDYIVSAGDVNAQDVTTAEFIENIRGEEGTIADIGVVTSNGEESSLEIQRRAVVARSVSSEQINDTVALIKIKNFTNITDEEFIKDVHKFIDLGISNFIVDLRGNTGGPAETVIAMLDEIVPLGLIVKFEVKDGKGEEHMSSPSSLDARFILLTNGMTASASELFCQCLKDYGMGIVIGENTYGKGTVVSTYSLTNGGSLTLSTALYKTLSGYEIENNGVIPNVELSLPEEKENIAYKLSFSEDDLIQRALEVFESETEFDELVTKGLEEQQIVIDGLDINEDEDKVTS